MNKIILAIVGLSGAGKTEVSQYIQKKMSWPMVYLGEITFEELEKNNLPINETNERIIREGFRKKYGMGAYAILNIKKIKSLHNDGNVVQSLYSWEEYLELKKEFGNSFKVLAVYSSLETRIKRLSNRKERPLTREEVISRDYSQIENLHQAGPIAYADFIVINEGSKEDLYRQLDDVLMKLK